MGNKTNSSPILKILCRQIQDALRFKRTSCAVTGLIVGEARIAPFREFYEPMLITGGFKVKYVNVFRHKRIYVVLSWDKALI